MSELPGTTAVGIERVEWLDAGLGNLTVRVTGRWRRRRGLIGSEAAPPRPTMLVIETEAGHHHRVPATPEPPSVGGAAPGMWRLSFSVPAEIAPRLGHTWLAFGSVTVPLPVPGSGVGAVERTEPPAARDEIPPQPRGAEGGGPPDPASSLAIERAWRRAEDAESESARLSGRLGEIERELDQARRTHDEVAASIAERERGRRVAEQRAHAEEAMRRDLARQLADGARETARARQAMGDLATAEARIRELERELAAARRAGDEAGQAAAAARFARERAERALSEHEARRRDLAATVSAVPAAPRGQGPERARLDFEERLRARRAGGEVRIPAEPSARAVRATAPAREAAPSPAAAPVGASEPAPVPTPAPLRMPAVPGPGGGADSVRVAALRTQLDGRAREEAALRARTITAESRLAARVLLEQRTTQTLRELRVELDRLGSSLRSERDGRQAAEAEVERLRAALGGERERSHDASAAIGELRGTLAALRPPVADAEHRAVPEPRDRIGASPPTPPASPGPGGEIDPDALSAALSRLRAAAPPRDDDPAAAPDGPDVVSVSGSPASPPPAAALSAALALPAAPTPPAALLLSAALVPPSVPTAPVAGSATVERAFRRLAGRDPDGAGRLLLSLLPCQHAAYPHPVAYDLVLGPGRGCVQVTAGKDGADVTLQGAARAREQVDFQVIGEPARIARLLSASPLRRLVRFGIARVRGRRDGLGALRALLALPLDLGALRAAGLPDDGESILRVVAALIEPDWTRGEAFTIAYRDGESADVGRVFLIVAEGRAPVVSRAEPVGRVATTVSGPASGLASLLGGAGGGGATVSGDSGPLDQLRAWANRAKG